MALRATNQLEVIMSKDTLVMLFPIAGMVFYLIMHFTLWRGQESNAR